MSEEPGTPASVDPLPSWRPGAAKQAIIQYVERTTRPGTDDFVPPHERVAVFDNDGTLWPENPVPFQLAFLLDRLREGLSDHPEWQDDEMVQAALSGEVSKLVADGYHGLLHVVSLTHAGMTTDAFSALVDTWMDTARHPRYGRPFDECIYEPMREVLAFLRANGFKTFIVSGGGADFMRAWAERVYGIPPENVVGSHGVVRYAMVDGSPVLTKSTEEIFVDDRDGKPAGIHLFIGRRPVVAFGNSDGDKAMLEYTTVDNPRPTLGVIVHHTDAEREYAYDAAPRSTGKLVEALAEAPERGWVVVDMANDWARVLGDDSVTAIDVLLEPDETMLRRAEEVNAELLSVYSDGYPLDETHRPHVTLMQRFVRTSDLAAAYDALGQLFAGARLGDLELRAAKHEYIPDGDVGLAGIVVEATRELLQLQREVMDALAPFCVDSGTSQAFVRTPDDLVMNPLLIRYVETFVPEQTGERFNPHVSTGVAPRAFLDEMLARPFDAFSFGVAGAAVYQLGQWGTAARRLKSF